MSKTRFRLNEDWLALYLGLFLFVLSLGLFAGVDLLGWTVKTSVWTDISTALKTASATYAGLPGVVALMSWRRAPPCWERMSAGS